jgi:hypothetical protein
MQRPTRHRSCNDCAENLADQMSLNRHSGRKQSAKIFDRRSRWAVNLDETKARSGHAGDNSACSLEIRRSQGECVLIDHTNAIPYCNRALALAKAGNVPEDS